MGEELVGEEENNDSLSITSGDGESHPHSYTQIMTENFSQYLFFGMTPEQYWDQDSTLAVHYRKAFRLREEQADYHAWLQGAYVYEAILDASPILHAFAKAGTKPQPYSQEPYTVQMNKRETKEQTISKEEVEYNKKKAYMMNFASAFNNRKEGTT